MKPFFKTIQFLFKKNSILYTHPFSHVVILNPVSYNFHDIERTTNCILITNPAGNQLLIDPSPVNDIEYSKFLDTLKMLDFFSPNKKTQLFITHHHIDHYKNINKLARDFSLPIIMSSYTHSQILKEMHSGYLDQIQVIHACEGDVLMKWRNQKLLVYEIPGHDEGQLGLAPENLAWFIVGDLIENSKSVVIPEESGSIEKYYKTLDRIITLAPDWIIPSHGKPLKSIDPLRNILKHRKKREVEIYNLYQQGKSINQILEILYSRVHKNLWPLALENIKSHIKYFKSNSKNNS